FLATPAPPQRCTPSLHDALPISAGGDPELQGGGGARGLHDIDDVAERLRRRLDFLDLGLGDTQILGGGHGTQARFGEVAGVEFLDRKSTRLNSSHVSISYAVFCL